MIVLVMKPEMLDLPTDLESPLETPDPMLPE